MPARDPAVTGRDHYAQIYREELDAEAKWLQYGAVEKVNSIEQLLAQVRCKPQRLVELGCGPGAVIRECQRRGIGDQLTAIDYSRDAISFLASRSSGIRCVVADVTAPDFEIDGEFDVV